MDQEFDKKSAEDYNEKEFEGIYENQEDAREKQVLKKAKILLISALTIVVALAIWMSLWIFA